MLRHLFSALAVLAIGASANAASISVADGDSFRLNGERYRLQDIDAPELHQMCKDAAGRAWACGREARDQLRKLLNQQAVKCEKTNRDRFGRFIAVCRVGGRDIGETMIRNGWATAYKGRGLTSRYVTAENEARAARRGLWAGSFQTPRQWRDGHPRDEDGEILSRDAQIWLRAKADAVAAWLRGLWRPASSGEQAK
jgi:endonuclease YncB( thermonuclease family)